MTAPGVLHASETLPGLAAPQVEWVTNPSRFDGMCNQWNELLGASGSDCLFLTWEWLHTWWKHLGAERQLSILAVRSGEKLTAIVPLVRSPPSPLRLRLLSTLEFLGSGSVGSDYLDCIIRRGDEATAVRSLAAELSASHAVLDCTQVRRGASSAELVAQELAARRWSVSETVTNVCPYIPLAGKSWTNYLGSLGAEHRYNFHRKWKRLNRDYAVRFAEVGDEQQCREAIELVFHLHNTRWQNRGGSDAFHTSAMRDFHREFSLQALHRGWLRLYVLRLNETPVACLYGFLYGRTFYFYQSGFDSAYQKHSVGLITMGLAMQKAIEEGAEEYDLLHGNEAYKSHWSRDQRELSRLEFYPPDASGWLCRQSMEVERASRRLARRVLGGRPT